ncbi:MAG: TonB family protein [Candidatus Korobacteraceae bacterium]
MPLQSLADSVQMLTSADGVAIALAEGDAVICRASSGIAPEIGVAINPAHGLSGECLRTGLAVRCDDTAYDSRLDPDLCRNLNLRSILVLPLKHNDKLVGIFEWFSSKPRAIDGQTLSLLYTYAEVATELVARAEPALATADNDVMLGSEAPLRAEEQSRKTVQIGVAAALIVAAISGALIARSWKSSSSTSDSMAKGRSVSQSAPVAKVQAEQIPEQQPQEDLNIAPPQKAVSHTQVTGKVQQHPVTRAVTRASAPKEAKEAQVQWTISKQLKPSRLLEPVSPAPLGSASAQIPALPQTGASMPVLGPETSSGPRVSGGTLIARVEPVYPEAARRFRKEGLVVIAGLVDRNGVLQQLRVLQGDSMLAAAAMAAAAQWRYEPFRVDDEVVEKPMTITFRFKL